MFDKKNEKYFHKQFSHSHTKSLCLQRPPSPVATLPGEPVFSLAHTLTEPFYSCPAAVDNALPTPLLHQLVDVIESTRDSPKHFWISVVDPIQRQLRTAQTFLEQLMQYLYHHILPVTEMINAYGFEYWVRVCHEDEIPAEIAHTADPLHAARGLPSSPAASFVLFVSPTGVPHLMADQRSWQRGRRPAAGWACAHEANRVLMFPGDMRAGRFSSKVARARAGVPDPPAHRASYVVFAHLWPLVPAKEPLRSTPEYAGEVFPSNLWYTPPVLRPAPLQRIGADIAEVLASDPAQLAGSPLVDEVVRMRLELDEIAAGEKALSERDFAHREAARKEAAEEMERKVKKSQVEAAQIAAWMRPRGHVHGNLHEGMIEYILPDLVERFD